MENNGVEVLGTTESKEETIVKEYEEVLDGMMKQIDVFQVNITKLKDRYLEVIQENSELANSLKESLFFRSGKEKVMSNNEDPLTVLANNLLLQLDLASQEKELFIEFCQVVFEKICHLEEKLAMSPESNGQMEESKAALNKLRLEYSDIIHILEAQLSSLRVMLTKEREKHEMQMLIHAEKSEMEYHKVCDQIAESKAREERAEKNEAAYVRDIAELKKCKQNAEELLKAAARREELAVGQIEEALNVADAAVREKDVALIQEGIAREEMNQMKKTVAELVEDAGIRVKEEVDIVRRQFNLRIQEMIGEMALKEKESATLRQEWEECKRKRKGLERCLERLAEKGIKEPSIRGDGAPVVETHEHQIKWLEQELQMEREGRKRLENEMVLLERRLGGIAEKQRNIRITEPVKENIEVSQKKQSASVQLAQELKEQISRLENIALCSKRSGSAEENPSNVQKPIIVHLPSNMTKSADLHEILNAQLEMKQRWKQEANDLTQKLGKRIKELHAEVDKLKLENKELHLQLKKKIGYS